MNSNNVITVVLDACVLYPAPVRDLLLSLAFEGLFEPKWSKRINEEWKRNLLANRVDIKKEKLVDTINSMNLAFPFANTSHFNKITKSVDLPDKNDNHVLACGIKSKSQFIITSNLKDFPNRILNEYNITAIHPDKFILNVIKSDEESSIIAFTRLIERLKNPPLKQVELLKIFKKIGLVETSYKISHLTKTPPK